MTVTEWLEAHDLPHYGSEGCRCGSLATPSPDCPLHYFMVVVGRLEDCVKALLRDRGTPYDEETRAKAAALIGLD